MSPTNLKFETKTLRIGQRDIALDVPANPEDVLSGSLKADGSIANDPYWGILWPAAAKTAKMIVERDWSGKAANALEVGCGTGLTGIAALMCGHTVTFSDAVPQAVELAIQNARRNGFANVRGLIFDWHHPVDEKFDLIIASDVLYEVSGHQPLLNVLRQMLTTKGEVLLGDTGRGHAIRFLETASNAGWDVSVLDECHRRLEHPVRLKFQLFRLTRHFPAEKPSP